jgi:hypothetical protein
LIEIRKGKERKGKERKGKERKGKERKGKERKGKERKGKHQLIHSVPIQVLLVPLPVTSSQKHD